MTTPKPISCDEALRRMLDFLNRELDEQQQSEVEHHMDACRACFSRAEFERRLKQDLSRLGREPAPATVKSRIQALLRGY